MTRREARSLSIKVAKNLLKLNVKPDDVVGFVCKNSKFVAPLMYGCIIVGAPIHPLDVSFTKDEIKQLFEQTKPKVVFCDADVYETTRDALKEFGHYAKIFTLLGKVPEASFVDEILEENDSEHDFEPPKFRQPNHKKVVGILCTSGTTGTPKGTALPHSYFLTFTKFAMAPFPMKSFVFSSIYWVSGFSSNILVPFRENETKVQTLQPFSPETFAEIIEKHQINSVLQPPAYLHAFLKSPASDSVDLSCVKLIFMAGAMVSSELLKLARGKLPTTIFLNAYE